MTVTAPVDGIYAFYSLGRTYGTGSAFIKMYLKTAVKAYAYRYEDNGYDTVTVRTQFKLIRGDTVHVRFDGVFYGPSHSCYAFFEGHLIRQINE